MRATSAKFLKPTESDEPDLREGWLKKLKAKFTDKEKILLEDEFENLDTVVLPKMSFFAQEEFYKALKSLTLYELQEGFKNCIILPFESRQRGVKEKSYATLKL